MNKFIFILLLSHLVCIPQTYSLPHKSEEENLFHEINRHIESTLNGIFSLMQLNKNFTFVPKNQILLSMHGNIKALAERNYKAFKIVKKTTKLTSKQKSNSGVFNLQKLCDIIVQEILTPDNATKYSAQTNKTGINLNLTSLEIPDKLADTLSFLKEYFSNVEDTYAFSIDSTLNKIKKEFEKNRKKAKMRRNLRAWKAENDTRGSSTNYTDTRRVYHGTTSKIKKYPFLASVHVMRQFVCSGSIISKDMILTAATCLHVALTNNRFLRDYPDGVQVRVGSAYTHRFGDVRLVTQIFFHPEYNIENLHNNLAILKIDRLYFTENRMIRRIEYQRWKGRLPSHVNEIMMLGWGDKDAHISGEFDPLSFSILNIFNQTRCTQTYSGKYVNEKNFCAGFVMKGSGACQRDVGGPAIVGSTLVGIVSFGPPVCGTPNAPTVFSSVGHDTSWIDSILKVNFMNKRERAAGHTVVNKHPLPNERVSLELESQTKPNIPIMIPKSQYPQAIEVLQHLLTKLTNNDKHNTKIEKSDYDDESSDEGIVVDFDELVKVHGKNTAAKAAKSNYHSPQNLGNENVMRAHKDRETLVKKKADDFVNINTGKIMDDLVARMQTELVRQSIMAKSSDPFFVAIKSLGNYLGLEKLVHVTQDYKIASTTEDVKRIELPYFSASKTLPSDEIITTNLEQNSAPRSYHGEEYFTPTYFSPSSEKKLKDSDNENNLRVVIGGDHIVNGDIELEDGTSPRHNDNSVLGDTEFKGVTSLHAIDKNEEIVRTHHVKYEPIDIDESNDSNYGISDPNDVSDNYESESEGLSIELRGTDTLTTARMPYEAQTRIDLLDRAQQFLNKNFVKDENVPITQNDKKDELVVLVLKKTTKMTDIPDNKLRKQIRLNVNGTPIMLPSRYSVVSNIGNIIALESINETIDNPKSKIDFPYDIVDTFFTDIPVATSHPRSFIDANIHYTELPILSTFETGTRYRSDTNVSESKTVKTNPFSISTTPFLTTSTTISSTTTLINSTTVNFINTNTTLATSAVTSNTAIINTTVSNNYNSSSSPIDKELTMAAYDFAEVLAEKEEDEEEDDSDLEIRRRLLDYINIT